MRAALLLALAGCKDRPAPDSDAPPPEGFAWGEAVVCADPSPGIEALAEVGADRGLDRALPTVAAVLGRDVPGMGGALTVADLDADGHLDLLTGGADGRPDAWLNDGAGHFSRFALSLPGATRSFALLAADLDGDLLPELIAPNAGAVPWYRNLGGLRFTWAGDLALGPSAPSLTFQTVAAGDLDGDGWLDLLLPSISEAGTPDGVVTDYGGPDVVLLGGPAGFAHALDLVVAGDGSRSQVGLLSDLDDDGDLDAFIPADLGPPSALWRNDGRVDGRLALVEDAAGRGAALAMAAMGVAVADLNHDGAVDLCLSDVGDPRCLLSDGAGGFVESRDALGAVVAEPLEGAPVPTIGWSIELVDLDNDGFVELVQASGPEPSTWASGLTAIPDVLWQGGPDGFEDRSRALGFDDPANHIGLAAADFDGDGRPELVVAGPGEPPRLYATPCGPEAWLEVELIGPVGSVDGFGARVVATAGGAGWLGEVHGLRDKAQGPSRVHLGLGDAAAVDLEVRWPDGVVQRAEAVPSRRRVTVRHPDAPEVDFGPWDGPWADPSGAGAVTVLGRALDDGADAGLEGVDVGLLDGAPLARSDSGGHFTLALETAGAVDLVGAKAGRVTVVLPLDTRFQTQPQDGVELRMLREESLSRLYEQVLGRPPDTARAAVWVSAIAPAGTRLAVDGAHAAPFVMGPSGPVAGDTLAEDSYLVAFPDAEPGTRTVSGVTPDGGGCEGRTEVPARAGALTMVRLRCG